MNRFRLAEVERLPRMQQQDVETMLAHVFRCPELFAEARSKLVPSDFGVALSENKLSILWEVTRRLLSRFGDNILTGNFGSTLADEVRRSPDMASYEEDIRALIQPGDGLLDRIFGPDAASFNEGYGRELLRRFLLERRVVRPLVRTVEELWAEESPQKLAPVLQELAQEAMAYESAGVVAPQSLLSDWADYQAGLEVYRGREILGLRTGMPTLDQRTLGLRGMLVLGAKPNVGKTTLALQLGLNAVRQNADACLHVVSLEMSRRDLAARVHCNLAQLDWTTLMLGNEKSRGQPDGPFFTDSQITRLQQAEQWMATNGQRVCIDDRDSLGTELTASAILARLNAFKQSCGASRALVVLDYLQLLPIPADKAFQPSDLEADKYRVRVVQDIVRGTRTDANPLGDPVLVISEARKPSNATQKQVWGENLADLMGSARIAYAADAVLLYRRLESEQEAEKVYGPKNIRSESRLAELEQDGIAPMMLSLAKGRDGMRLGQWPVSFFFTQSLFREVEPYNRASPVPVPVGTSRPAVLPPSPGGRVSIRLPQPGGRASPRTLVDDARAEDPAWDGVDGNEDDEAKVGGRK
jgi:replicative DNA helicase